MTSLILPHLQRAPRCVCAGLASSVCVSSADLSCIWHHFSGVLRHSSNQACRSLRGWDLCMLSCSTFLSRLAEVKLWEDRPVSFVFPIRAWGAGCNCWFSIPKLQHINAYSDWRRVHICPCQHCQAAICMLLTTDSDMLTMFAYNV